MKNDPTTPRRKRHLLRWGIAFIVVAVGSGGWKAYDFSEAAKEAKALGWVWQYDDPFVAIQADWKVAFRKATWLDRKRYLFIPKGGELVRHRCLVHRLQPQQLWVYDASGLTDLAALDGLSSLRALSLERCEDLTNVDALRSLHGLKRLGITGSRKLPNVDPLKGLSRLEVLDLSGSTGLTSIDALKSLNRLGELKLNGCTGFSAGDIETARKAVSRMNAQVPQTIE